MAQTETDLKNLLIERAVRALPKLRYVPLKVTHDTRHIMEERPFSLALLRHRPVSSLDIEREVSRREWRGHTIPHGSGVVRSETIVVAAMFTDYTIDRCVTKPRRGRWQGEPVATLFRDRGDFLYLVMAEESQDCVVPEPNVFGQPFVIKRDVYVTLIPRDGGITPGEIHQHALEIAHAYDYRETDDEIKNSDRVAA